MAGLQEEIERVERLRSAAKGKGPLPEEGISIALEPTILYGKAWETATLTQALAREDFRIIMSLAAIYELQRWMALIEDKWLQSLLDPAASPVLAVGSTVIDLTPTPLKEWAIRQFGSSDKAVLTGSV